LIAYLDLPELTSAPASFDRPGWIFELKYDGYRMFASSVDSEPQLLSRRGTDQRSSGSCGRWNQNRSSSVFDFEGSGLDAAYLPL
jgi:hypothetical protein